MDGGQYNCKKGIDVKNEAKGTISQKNLEGQFQKSRTMNVICFDFYLLQIAFFRKLHDVRTGYRVQL